MAQKLVLVSGCFNVLHPGHLRLLRFARDCGDRLLVAVESDQLAGSSAHVPEALRLEGVQSISWVDEAVLVEDSITTLIRTLRPDVVVKGKEHETRDNPELVALSEFGGKLIFSSGETVFSSLDLLKKEFRQFNPSSVELPTDYMSRHQIDRQAIQAVVDGFSQMSVCVVGDLIIDEYITCQPLGMSQEDPTIVVTPLDSQRFVGGAGIVAAHAAGLGATVRFVSVTGQDDVRHFAEQALEKAGVDATLLIDENRPTTLKQRFRSKGKTLLRVSHLQQGAIRRELQDAFLLRIREVIEEVDLLVFSDFNYGCLPQDLVDEIISLCHAHGTVMAADSQSSSQVGDVSRFIGMNLLTPTEREARISTRNQEDGLVVLAEALRSQSSAHNTLLKLGEEGVLIHASADDGRWQTDRVGALNSSPKDVAGAGDSLLIASALALASGSDIWVAALLGSLAAAVQVGRVGNLPIQRSELLEELIK